MGGRSQQNRILKMLMYPRLLIESPKPKINSLYRLIADAFIRLAIIFFLSLDFIRLIDQG